MRYAALPFVFASLLLGMLAGLWRAGFTMIDLSTPGNVHGSLMTGAFLGSLISLERAIVIKKWYAYTVPLIGGLSTPFFFIYPTVAYVMLCFASAGLVFIMGWLYMKYSEWYHLIFIVGAACWLAGNVLILTGDYYFFSAPWWMLFFLFTITAERMELARFVLLQKSRIILLTSFLGLSFISLLVPFHAGGKLLLGLSFALVALTLLRYDIARKNTKSNGIHRYSGYALMTGYGWLLLTGIGMMILPYSGLIYDALLHGFFLGFVFSMILAHGPIILPTILKQGTFVYHPVLWFWLFTLTISLATRLCSDLLGSVYGRLIGSWGNAIAILCFLFTVAALVFQKRFQHCLKTTS
ncbi:MAG: hypothetical protein R2813_10825 [Flavobacteriales bacterium]